MTPFSWEMSRIWRRQCRYGTASAEVAAHPLAQLIVVEHDVFCCEIGRKDTRHASLDLVGHPDRRTDLTRRAVAALKAVVFDEGALKRVKLAFGRKALDRRDGTVLILDGQGEAGIDPPTVHQHGAGAAGTLVATLFRPSEIKMVTEEVEKRCPEIDLKLVSLSVNEIRHGVPGPEVAINAQYAD